MKDYHIPRHMCAVPLKDKNEFIINLQFRDFAPSSNFILFLSSDVFQIGFSRGRHRSADIIALSDPSEFSANTSADTATRKCFETIRTEISFDLDPLACIVYAISWIKLPRLSIH